MTGGGPGGDAGGEPGGGPGGGPGLDFARLLNPEQLRAATHPGGPLLIVAGAGSGKTRTLVYRVAWLVERGFVPESILLVTFTRKASAEMLGRCAELVGDRAGRVSGGTFHSLANLLLRRHAHHLGYTRSFTVMDQDDAEQLIGRLRAEENPGSERSAFPKKRAILGLISQAVNRDAPLGELIRLSQPHLVPFAKALGRIADEYQRRKRAGDLMDFDDLLVNLEKVMRLDEAVRLQIAGRYRHVLVDEYQDTNAVQARLTRLLGLDHGNVTAVGDEAQSIYSFRGANFRNIMEFTAIFPGATVIKLEDNYRSRPEVLSFANHLTSLASESFGKTLRPHRPEGPKPRILILDSLGEEAEAVAGRVEALADRGVPLKDVAVLFRAGSHSFELEAELTRRRIPYSKFGGRKFLEMAHIKDFLCLLRLGVNPGDPLGLARVLALIDGVGPKSVANLTQWATRPPANIRQLHEGPAPPKARAALLVLSDLLAAMASPLADSAAKADLAWKWYEPRLEARHPDDHAARREDLRELIEMAGRAPDLAILLSELNLDPPNTLQSGPPAAPGTERSDLTLSTIHSAKGLEWPHVFIISCVDGRFPSPFSLGSPQSADEELRLMYVAATRAMDELTLTVPMAGGELPPDGPPPSRFLAGLADGQVEVAVDGRPSDASVLGVPPGPEGSPMGAGCRWARRPGGHYRPPARPRTAPKPPPKPETGAWPETGQRVGHPIYGTGRVERIEHETALIDFDHWGRKSVMIPYARLTILEG